MITKKVFNLIVFLIISDCVVKQAYAVILTPPYFNLVTNKKVTATATCGEDIKEPEFYCKLTGSTATDRETSNFANIIQGQYCYYCDPRDPAKTHHANYSIDGTERWWQSPPLSRGTKYNMVNLTIDLGQEFHVAYIYIKMANSPRPGVWALEKSNDFGQTFTPWQYFADTPSDCNSYFGVQPTKAIRSDDQVVCTTEYSKVLPVEGGEILLSLVNNRPNSKNFTHSDVLQNWTRATNVRLRLIRTKNLLGHLMAVAREDPTVTRRYFYSIRDISIGGRCVCNGHAQYCDASNLETPNKLICRCSHNTCGDQCEQCCPGFMQKKWQPNRENQEFECEPCQCYGHSDECVYDPEVEAKGLSIDIHGNYQGGGVCQNCDHNTEGINCEKCKLGYYRPFGVPINSTDACQKCNCDSRYSTGNCAQNTGQCECKPQYTGLLCDKCANGYTDFPICKPCECNIHGSIDNKCFPPCSCKFGYLGPKCDQCVDGYYGFPNCKHCECDRVGTQELNCDKLTGSCSCRAGYSGFHCSECASGFYRPALAVTNNNNGMCLMCQCDMLGTESEICHKNNGTCICKPNFSGKQCNECAPGYYNFPKCLPCDCNEQGSMSAICKQQGENQQCDCITGRAGPKCDRCAPGYYNYPECLECGCDFDGSIGRSCVTVTVGSAIVGTCTCKANFIGEKCNECAPNLFNFPKCEECRCHPDGTSPSFPGCNKNIKNLPGIICPCREHVTGTQCDQCKDGYYGLSKENENGCLLCQCNRDGSFNELELCELNSGQCHCKENVNEIACNQCKPGSFNLERNNLFGCQSCDCQIGSSLDNNCDQVTGKCRCLPNIVGQKCDKPAPGFYLPDMHQLKFEFEDGYSALKRNKQVRYDFDDSVFPGFSWRGYVHLTRVLGEVAQDVRVEKPGTYRLIIKYVNKNPELTELTIRVRQARTDEQTASVYLSPAQEPKYETVTVNQISALTLELESTECVISFQTRADKLFVDYFILLPSDFYESTGLEHSVESACSDYRNDELCIQYRLVSLSEFTQINAASELNNNLVDLDSIKEFNHSNTKPFLAAKLSNSLPLARDVQLAPVTGYTLMVDFLNLNEDGSEVQVEITSNDGRVQTGKVYLYKCNYTTLCREVLLSDDRNVPLVLSGSNQTLSLKLKSDSPQDILIHKLTFVPKDKFHMNQIRMQPHCVVKNKKCLPLDYIQISGAYKLDLDESHESVSSKKAAESYIPTSKTIYLNDYVPSLSVPARVPRRDEDQVLVVHYYQPNYPVVTVSLTINNNIKGSFEAEYCPSVSGCRAIVTFESSGEIFNSPDVGQIQFELTQNRKDIWIDYLLFASASSVKTDNLHAYAPVDFTNDFISKCASSNHFAITFGQVAFCDKSVFSLSAKYNKGALECGCDPEGSLTSEECSPFGGQCACRENVIGRNCSKCKSGYFGFPNCQKCVCASGNCDDITGQCICPPNVEEGACTVCVDNTYGFHPKFGCEECNCETQSTLGNSKYCDKETGQCECKQNTDGLRCDKCKSGYYSYPECNECDCNKNGTTEQVCSAETAECKCKENVDGNRCEYCQPGTFNLEARNPKGCTKCFCFGLTSECSSAYDLYLLSLNSNLSNWSLENLEFGANDDQIKQIKVANTDRESVKLEFSDDLARGVKLSEPVYWSAPHPFLGNKVTSYGGSISYKIRINSPSSPDAVGVIRPDLILVSQNIINNLTLVYTSLRQPAQLELFENRVDLIESSFSYLQTGSSVTREHLMLVLSSLKEIKLRASYYNRLHESELISFEMDTTSQNRQESTREALSAEYCRCPPNYNGYSCESCSDGFYKLKSSGPGLFTCAACQCNYHAEKCDQNTGVCLDCQGNTEGLNCEKCKKGYYRVELGAGRFECQLCPCPGRAESNVFADSCMYNPDSNQVYYCQCNKGYTGQFCERCAPGYHGNPNTPGGKCLPCECNNNINMNDFESCDQRTGECKKCLNNTAGSRCEQCAYWHYGDPIERKDCKPCECNECGSESCDARSGECKCKKNVLGLTCQTCGVNQYGFNKCNGCFECDCDPVGSTSTQCDVTTGQCLCKPGVQGRRCDQCRLDHWNFSESGCTFCDCKKEGVLVTETGGFRCNSTNGYCECIPGVTGPNCDKCADRWVLVHHVGCKKCDTCIDTLLDDVDILAVKLDTIDDGNHRESSLTFKAHNKLVKLESEFKKIIESTDQSMYASTPLILLQKQIDNYQRNILPEFQSILALPLADKTRLIKQLLADAEDFNAEINSLRNKFDALDAVLNQLDKSGIESSPPISESELNIYEQMVDGIINKNLSSSLEGYRELWLNFEETNKTVSDLSHNFTSQLGRIEKIKEQNAYVQKSLLELKSLITKAKLIDTFTDKDVSFRAYFENLAQIKNETNKLQELSSGTLDQIEQIVKQAEQTLAASNDNLGVLGQRVDDLKSVYLNHDTTFGDLQKKCLRAEQKAADSASLSRNWQTRVRSLQDGLTAFEMTQTYEKISFNYNEAHNKSVEILNSYKTNDAKLGLILENSEKLKNKTELLVKNCDLETDRRAKSEKDYEKNMRDYNELDHRTRSLEKTLTRIDQWINKTLTSDTILAQLKSELDSQQKDLNKHEDESAGLIKRIQSLDSLRTSLPRPENGDEFQSGDNLIKYIDETINNLNVSAPRLSQDIVRLQQEGNFNSELEQIRNDIYELKLLLTSARNIANEIKVAVNFTDSTFIQLKASPDLQPSLVTSGSVYVQTRESFAPIVYIYNESNPNEYVSVYLEGGRPQFQYRLSDKEEGIVKLSVSQPINDGQWHKIEFERVGKAARLAVHTDERKQEVTQESQDNSVIFNIDPNGAKIQLGQFPNEKLPSELRTVAAYGNQFRGAIDDMKLNGHSYGLWNFDQGKNIKGEPKRTQKSPDDQSDSDNDDAVRFMENSFMCFSPKTSPIKLNVKNPIDVTVQFKTDSPNGLLWLWYNDEKQYIAVFMESGYVNVAVLFSNDDKKTLFDKYEGARLDDNRFHSVYVRISVRKSTDGTNMQELEIVLREISGNMQQSSDLGKVVHKLNRKPFVRNGQQCLGGIQTNKREGIFKDAQFNSFTGCISSVFIPTVDDKKIDLPAIVLGSSDIQASNVVRKCSEADQCLFRKSNEPVFLQFELEKYLNERVEEETIGISFVTANPDGILFYKIESRSGKTNSIYLQLKERKLLLTYHESDSSFSLPLAETKKQYSDNNLHIVYVIKRKSRLILRVDDEQIAAHDNTMEDNSDSYSVLSSDLYVGGIPESQRDLLTEESFTNFEGCITQVIYNNKELKFNEASNAKQQSGLSFANCYKTPIRSSLLSIPAYKQLQSSIINLKQTNSKPVADAEDTAQTTPPKDAEECSLSKQYDTSQLRSVGLRFGLSKRSRLEVHDSFAIKITTFVSFKFRTLQSEGLMFYASDAQYNDFISVWLQDGYVNYAFDCGTGFMHIKSKRTYSDGRYHTVTITRDKQFGALIVSDRTNSSVIEKLEDRSIGEASSLSVVEPYYFGNIPENDRGSLPSEQTDLIMTEPFVGCMSDFIIGYKTLKTNLERVELMNCSNNHESGLFFTGLSQTSHASLSNYLSLRDTFEVSFEVKSRTKNGVVLYVGSRTLIRDYLLVELINGELNYKWNTDGLDNVVKYVPQVARNELCNSSWIRIKLRKEENGLIMLELKGSQYMNSFAQDVVINKEMNTLYLGALPNRSLYAEITQTNEPFVGCIRDLSIRKNSGVYANNKVLLDMNLEDGVLNYCPLK